jgi:hypothetical protein
MPDHADLRHTTAGAPVEHFDPRVTPGGVIALTAAQATLGSVESALRPFRIRIRLRNGTSDSARCSRNYGPDRRAPEDALPSLGAGGAPADGKGVPANKVAAAVVTAAEGIFALNGGRCRTSSRDGPAPQPPHLMSSRGNRVNGPTVPPQPAVDPLTL